MRALTDRRGARGLSSDEAALRLSRDGPNVLPGPRRVSWVRRLARQMYHFFALLLWVAAGLAYLGHLPQLAIAIAVVVVVNALFAFVQESRADRAAERLRDLLPRKVKVRRDGVPVLVDAADVVAGDVLLLEAGDRVPADAVVADARSALIDTSMLTGESEPTSVAAKAEIFAGTFCLEGEIDADVRATGVRTRLAEIARLTTATPKAPTPLTLELARVVRTIAVIAIAVGGSFFVLALLLGMAPSEGFVFGVGVTVALVPEALLPTVTMSLAWGAEQMAKRKVRVRNLDAVETLGSTTFICTDKTGTLTRNEMTVVEAWAGSDLASRASALPGFDPALPATTAAGARPAVERLAIAAVQCSSGYLRRAGSEWVPQGDPMEVAIDVFARRLGIDTDEVRRSVVADARFPFDPRRRRMSILVDGELVVKGAPEAVLPLCRMPGPDGTLARLTAAGFRVLAVGGRHCSDRPRTADEAERDLELYGLLVLEDPPRDDVAVALRECRSAGVKVAMVTGDHPATATAIATETGLRDASDPVVIGADLPTTDADLAALLDHDGIVVARVSPEDKLRIARALRARGHVVAMTGDGVNDGPALHEASIGIAMGASGTDVAREAADLVLLDDHFGTIVAGIEQGRATYLNVRKFLTYHLTDNVAELAPFVVWAISGGRFPLALGVLQILALDIGTDTWSATALGTEPPRAGILAGPPVSGRLLNRSVLRRAFGLFGPLMAVGALAAFLVSFYVAGWRPGDAFPTGHIAAAASGATFMTVVLAQTVNAFSCRSSTRSPASLGWFTNRLLVPAASAELIFSLVVLLVPAAARELGHRPPPLAGWAVAFASAGAVFAADWVDKRYRYARASGSNGARRMRRPEMVEGISRIQ